MCLVNIQIFLNKRNLFLPVADSNSGRHTRAIFVKAMADLPQRFTLVFPQEHF